MDPVTKGEQWKLALLTGEVSPSDATDVLLENRLKTTNQQIAETLLPMAQLRAEQVSAGLDSDDEMTRIEAERINNRYNREPANESAIQDAHETAANLEGDVSPLAQKIVGNWLGKILSNDLVGEMEKELARTVDSYSVEQQENVLRLRHTAAQDHGVAR